MRIRVHLLCLAAMVVHCDRFWNCIESGATFGVLLHGWLMLIALSVALELNDSDLEGR
jgi:hypothetical protein